MDVGRTDPVPVGAVRFRHLLPDADESGHSAEYPQTHHPTMKDLLEHSLLRVLVCVVATATVLVVGTAVATIFSTLSEQLTSIQVVP